MNNYQVSYFGMLAERRGLAEENVSHSSETPAALYASLDAQHHLGLAVSDLRAAVDDEFVSWNHTLKDGDRVAFLPPMSGG
jgi:molybdopterin synthase sulfur carrier subunit